MTTAVSVVFYHPDQDAIDSAKSLTACFDYVIVIDNSDTECDAVKGIEKLIYLPLHENKGIAYALNVGLSKAKELQADILLTMDQDSRYPLSEHEIILKDVQAYHQDDIAIYAMATKEYQAQHTDGEGSFVHDAITSGNFLYLDVLTKHAITFSDDLFIDYVDFEFNRQILKAGLKIYQSYRHAFDHKIGNPEQHSILFFHFTCMNHAPIRYYYRFRNATYLYKIDRKYYQKLYFKTRVIDKIKMAFYDTDKKEKRRMIRQGIRDGRHKQLGAYQKNHSNGVK